MEFARCNASCYRLQSMTAIELEDYLYNRTNLNAQTVLNTAKPPCAFPRAMLAWLFRCHVDFVGGE